jgi:hypothetical protein
LNTVSILHLSICPSRAFIHPPCRVEMKETLSLVSRTVSYFSASSQSTSLISTRMPFRLNINKEVHFAIGGEHLLFLIRILLLELHDHVRHFALRRHFEGDFCLVKEDQVESSAEIRHYFDGLLHLSTCIFGNY